MTSSIELILVELLIISVLHFAIVHASDLDLCIPVTRLYCTTLFEFKSIFDFFILFSFYTLEEKTNGEISNVDRSLHQRLESQKKKKYYFIFQWMREKRMGDIKKTNFYRILREIQRQILFFVFHLFYFIFFFFYKDFLLLFVSQLEFLDNLNTIQVFLRMKKLRPMGMVGPKCEIYIV